MEVTKKILFELSEAGATSQADVAGAGFTGYSNSPIKITGKRKKKKSCEGCEFCSEWLEECDIEFMSEVEKELFVVKRGDKWCVIHGSPMVPGSKTDKPPGSIIKCFPTKAQADRMHKAIIISKIKRGEMSDIELFEPYEMQKPKRIFNNLNELMESLK